MAAIPEKYLDLLQQKKAFANLATTMADGSPQVTPVWFDYQDGRIRVNTAKGRVKARTLRTGVPVALLTSHRSRPVLPKVRAFRNDRVPIPSPGLRIAPPLTVTDGFTEPVPPSSPPLDRFTPPVDCSEPITSSEPPLFTVTAPLPLKVLAILSVPDCTTVGPA